MPPFGQTQINAAPLSLPRLIRREGESLLSARLPVWPQLQCHSLPRPHPHPDLMHPAGCAEEQQRRGGGEGAGQSVKEKLCCLKQSVRSHQNSKRRPATLAPCRVRLRRSISAILPAGSKAAVSAKCLFGRVRTCRTGYPRQTGEREGARTRTGRADTAGRRGQGRTE